MNRKNITLITLVTTFALFTVSNVVEASEITGYLNTGINSPGVIGVVITPPVASPTAGTYSSAQSVSLAASGASSIHYTVTGVDPTCLTGITYSSPISVDSSLTIRAISCYPNNQQSTVASYSYTINTLTASSFSASSGRGGGGGGGGSRSGITTNRPTAGLVLGASTGGGFQFTRTLMLGMSGQDVTELQNRLKAEGVYNGPVTGYFGLLTVAGVKAFQLKYGIMQTGMVGPITRAKLNEDSVSVLGAQTNMTTEQMKILLAQLQAQVAALMLKLNNSAR